MEQRKRKVNGTYVSCGSSERFLEANAEILAAFTVSDREVLVG